MAGAHTRTTNYYSGQGVLLMADRDVNGLPTDGFIHVGNCSAVSIAIDTTVFEHKESQTGARATDLRLTQEVLTNVNITMESIDKENLSFALYGGYTDVGSGSVSAVDYTAKLGRILNFPHVKVSSVVVTDAGAVTTFEADKNYRLNPEAGSIEILTDAEQTAAGAASNITADEVLEISYSYEAQIVVNALTTTAPEKYLRFEGLNTADSNKPVVVEVFKFRPDPLQEWSLINDEIAQLEIAGSALQDGLVVSGSQYFIERALA